MLLSFANMYGGLESSTYCKTHANIQYKTHTENITNLTKHGQDLEKMLQIQKTQTNTEMLKVAQTAT